MARFAVKKKAPRDVAAWRLFEAQGLGTELDFIGPVRFGFAAFVFDGNDCAIPMKLHDVGLSAQPKSPGNQRNPACDSDAWPGLERPVVGPFMHGPPLGGKLVFFPEPFNMNESALPLAVQKVLKCRDGQEIHGWLVQTFSRVRRVRDWACDPGCWDVRGRI